MSSTGSNQKRGEIISLQEKHREAIHNYANEILEFEQKKKNIVNEQEQVYNKMVNDIFAVKGETIEVEKIVNDEITILRDELEALRKNNASADDDEIQALKRQIAENSKIIEQNKIDKVEYLKNKDAEKRVLRQQIEASRIQKEEKQTALDQLIVDYSEEIQKLQAQIEYLKSQMEQYERDRKMAREIRAYFLDRNPEIPDPDIYDKTLVDVVIRDCTFSTKIRDFFFTDNDPRMIDYITQTSQNNNYKVHFNLE